MSKAARVRPRRLPALAAAAAVLAVACSPVVRPSAEPFPCTRSGQPITLGFYAFFAPVSYSANPDMESQDFDSHLGYEADLLSALEAMEEARLSFLRRAIPTWPGIWLRSAGEFDVVGGGITILQSRRLDPTGAPTVSFTRPHIAFRQSLLARAADASRFGGYGDLTNEVVAGVLAGTTGEARLLQITGIAGEDGTLAAGTRVETPNGDVVADGTSAYFITSAGASENLMGRTRLHPPGPTMPQVAYLGDLEGEAELLEALRTGDIDVLARGEIGNGEASHASDGAFVIVALDSAAEYGGFTVDASRPRFVACLDDKVEWLTDAGEIGYAEWRADSAVFMKRAAMRR